MKCYLTVLLFFSIHCYLASICPPQSLLHRTYDGYCNNLLFRNHGKTLTYFRNGPEGIEPYPWAHIPKLDPNPTYADADLIPSSGPRGNARNISNYLFTRHNETDLDLYHHSMLSTMFGQFINHDLESNQFEDMEVMSFNPLSVYIEDREDYSCLATTDRPIPHGFRCNDTDTVLSSAVKKSGGTFSQDGKFRVFNNATSFLDLDHVYGRTKEINSKLRSKKRGKLLATDKIEVNIVIGTTTNYTVTLDNLLPHYGLAQVPVAIVFPTIGQHDRFFVAGDERVNENMALGFFHTLWMREHNKVCDEIVESNLIYKLFPVLFDEAIFQKARAITVAKYQKILYEQFFPTVYGDYFANKLGDFSGYNTFVDPSTSLVFASGAFRYGHYTPRPYFALDKCGVVIDHNEPNPDQTAKQIYLGFLNPSPAYLTPVGRIAECGGLANVARGLINERVQRNGLTIENILRNFTSTTGVTDLGTFDLIRARHNHMPNYQTVRTHYHGLDEITNRIYGKSDCPASLEHSSDDDPLECFLHITSVVETAQKIKDIYRKINNMDAIVGLQAEDHVEGTSFGRTSGNIIVDQFKRSRDGDRFFYKNKIVTGGLTAKEKKSIEDATMGDILRRNLGGDATSFPNNPFIAPENYMEQLEATC